MFINDLQAFLAYLGCYVLAKWWIKPSDLPCTFSLRNGLFVLPTLYVLYVVHISTISERFIVQRCSTTEDVHIV